VDHLRLVGLPLMLLPERALAASSLPAATNLIDNYQQQGKMRHNHLQLLYSSIYILLKKMNVCFSDPNVGFLNMDELASIISSYELQTEKFFNVSVHSYQPNHPRR